MVFIYELNIFFQPSEEPQEHQLEEVCQNFIFDKMTGGVKIHIHFWEKINIFFSLSDDAVVGVVEVARINICSKLKKIIPSEMRYTWIWELYKYA